MPAQHGRWPVGAGGDAIGRADAAGAARSRCRCGTPRPRAGSATAASVISRRPAPSAALPQRDVHRPVVAPRRGELAGAVDRVDDPYPVGCSRARSSWASSQSTASPGRSARSRRRISALARLSPGVAQRPGMVEADLLAHRQQQLAGVGGEIGGQRRIASRLIRPRVHRVSIADGDAGLRTPARESGDAGPGRASPGRPAARAPAGAAPRSPSWVMWPASASPSGRPGRRPGRATVSRVSSSTGLPAQPHSTVRSLSSTCRLTPWSTPYTWPSTPAGCGRPCGRRC